MLISKAQSVDYLVPGGNKKLRGNMKHIIFQLTSVKPSWQKNSDTVVTTIRRKAPPPVPGCSNVFRVIFLSHACGWRVKGVCEKVRDRACVNSGSRIASAVFCSLGWSAGEWLGPDTVCHQCFSSLGACIDHVFCLKIARRAAFLRLASP